MMELAGILISVLFLIFLFWIAELKNKDTIVRILSLLLFGTFLLIFLSFLSYSTISPEKNLGGQIGYKLSLYMFKIFGIILSYIIILIGFVSSLLIFVKEFDRKWFLRISSLFWVVFWLSVFLYLFLGSPIIGTVPQRIGIFIRNYLGIAGAVLLPLFLSIVAILPSIEGRIRGFKFFQKKREEKVELEETVEEEFPEVTPEEGEEVSTPRERKRVEVPREALLSLLDEPGIESEVDDEELRRNAELIEEKLEEFGVRGRVVSHHAGPVVTRYDYEPAPGIKLSRVVNLADDLALRMKSNKIRIVAPLPDQGLIGIEVPNKKRKIVYFKELAEREGFLKMKSKLGFALGVDTAGHPYYADLAKMPHLLIAGATGSGKSVCINTIIASILMRAKPEEVRLLLIDPKRIELAYYEGIPHLLCPVVKDRKEASLALKQAVQWMDWRYKHFAKDGVRDIDSHNSTTEKRKDTPLPYIVIIIDEFADLILTIGKEVEEPLTRLAQMARAVGIHLVVATQRPSVDVITGLIKANFPVRIAFKVPSRVDSKTILDEIGAEKLLGLGDMLFIPPGSAEPVRLHGPFISEDETRKIAQSFAINYLTLRLEETFGKLPEVDVLAKEIVERGLLVSLTRTDEPGIEERFESLVEYVAGRVGLPMEEVENKLIQLRETYYEGIPEMEEIPIEFKGEETWDLGEGFDPLLSDAAKLVVSRQWASATLLQRKFKIGFARAARIIDQLEKIGIVGPQEGSKARKVLVGLDELDEKMRNIKDLQGI
jgi:S-DNA-T family DNA segregation ATPase FtsK/SpoIIIE